ncbi:apolipoprotein N-acyltransferase [Jannaschia ovalis]|uniref:Apolipoprotein N-acyltransferase n=1 Tax=Jannaschia ovalis TaxID=3038773 RepID=A0ABY8LGL7_9RHOB|nr:apolipoprotein N-acyltransferase [Jannaschia sp. GRR-S6-38]WGH79304.1 apolipoprotein N-acyltransferase [Jannaschia sp. GRR-S6-38]
MHRLRALIPPLTGLAAALGQAPWSLWWLALPAYALGIAAIAGARRPFWAALAFGAAHFALALIWITEPFRVDPELTAWLAPIALGGVSLGFGLFWAVAGWAGARLLGGPLGVAVALGLVELLRSYLLTGFPWALPGHVLIESAALPAASVAGAHGLGLAVLLGAGLIASRRAVAGAAGLALWLLPFALGAALPSAPQAAADAPVVRLIQPNAPQHLKWDPDWIGVFFVRGLELAAAAPRGPEPVATIWPETALPELLSYSAEVRPMVARAAGTPVVIGAQRYDADRRPRNTMVLLDREGEIDLVHDKFRLVPFGEFLPMQGVFEAIGIGPLATRLAGRFAPGAGPITFDLPGVGPVMPLICYEAIFPQDIPRVDRPAAILHLTNDAWFGTRFGPQQHLALTRLRAAESGLPVLRAANTGVSAVIDARGRMLDALPLGTAGFLDAALPPALPPTPYMAIRDWGALVLLAALALALFVADRRKAVARRAKPA